MSGDEALRAKPGEALIRPAKPYDLPAILVIESESPEAPHWPPASYADMLLEDTARPQRRVLLVAERDGMIAGYAVGTVIPGDAELESIAVSTAFRRQGIGRRLGGTLIEWAKAHAANEIHLEVRASNAAAQELYEQLGFAKTAARRKYYVDPVEDAVLMTARLF